MKGFYAASLAAAASTAAAAVVPRALGDPIKLPPTPPDSSVYYYDDNGIPMTKKDPMGNTTIANPQYRAVSQFDYASFNLGLYQEYIELDLFSYGLEAFSDAEWDDAGVTAPYRTLLQFMADQETGHAQLLTNILGKGAAQRCTYNYTGAFSNVREYVDFNQQLTRWGESGVWGFLGKLNSRDAATLLSQSIATEARQQMIFRQFTGAPAMDVYFEPGLPRPWQWTLLAPWIQSCPSTNPPVQFSNYPALAVQNNPVLHYNGSKAAVSTNITQLVYPGEKIYFTWEDAGKKVGPDNKYTTTNSGKPAKAALFLNQLNASYAPLTLTGDNAGYVELPSGDVYNTDISYTGPAINGTGFVAIIDVAQNPHYTPYNLSEVLSHMVAGPAMFQSG